MNLNSTCMFTALSLSCYLTSVNCLSFNLHCTAGMVPAAESPNTIGISSRAPSAFSDSMILS